MIAGSKDKVVGRLQERYGIAKEETQRQLDDWLKIAVPAASRSRRKSPKFAEKQAKPM